MNFIHRFMNLILGLAAISTLSVFGYVFYFKSQSVVRAPSQAQKNPQAIDTEALVSKYMQETRLHLDAQKRATERAFIKGQLNAENPKIPIKETDPTKIPTDKQIWSNKQKDAEYLPDQINRKIMGEDEQRAQAEAEKKEYARQFIENARKDGYHIVLDDNLNVIKMLPIRKPSNNTSGPKYDQFETNPSN